MGLTAQRFCNAGNTCHADRFAGSLFPYVPLAAKLPVPRRYQLMAIPSCRHEHVDAGLVDSELSDDQGSTAQPVRKPQKSISNFDRPYFQPHIIKQKRPFIRLLADHLGCGPAAAMTRRPFNTEKHGITTLLNGL